MYSKQADTHFHGRSPRHVPSCCGELAEAQRAPVSPAAHPPSVPTGGDGKKERLHPVPRGWAQPLPPQVKRAKPGSQSSIHKCSSMKSDSHPSPLRICYFNEAQDVRIFANMSTAVKISSLERIPDRHMFYPSQNGQTLQRNIQRGKRFHIVTAISWDYSQPDNWDAVF